MQVLNGNPKHEIHDQNMVVYTGQAHWDGSGESLDQLIMVIETVSGLTLTGNTIRNGFMGIDGPQEGASTEALSRWWLCLYTIDCDFCNDHPPIQASSSISQAQNQTVVRLVPSIENTIVMALAAAYPNIDPSELEIEEIAPISARAKAAGTDLSLKGLDVAAFLGIRDHADE
jgi:hypothetical protein